VGQRAGLDGGEKAHPQLDSIPDRPAGKCNSLFDLLYDLPMKHTIK